MKQVKSAGVEILTTLTKQFSVCNKTEVSKRLLSEIEQEESKFIKRLNFENPFAANLNSLATAEDELQEEISDLSSIEDDFYAYSDLAKQTSSNIDEKFWKKEIVELENVTKHQHLIQNANEEDISKKALICRKLLIRSWRRLFDVEYSRWEIEAINKYRKTFLSKLEEWLKLLQQLSDAFEQLEIEPGYLFDLSKGGLSISDIELLRRWVEYLSKDEGVKQLCDILGKLRRAIKSTHTELVKTVIEVKSPIPDQNSKEEIIGIKLSNEIDYILPQEIALLADEEMSLLFDLKFVENRLMCFDMEGIQQATTIMEESILTEIDEEEKLGPILICVDTSGSMHGTPEMIAKAVTLFMATRALSQDRACYLINFSTGIETMELTKDMGIAEVIHFLKKSFHGGTDVDPALCHSLKLIEEDDYKKADVLVISDFLMNSISDELRNQIDLAKNDGNKFYSLTIGDLFMKSRTKEIFDGEWIYNPENCTVKPICQIVDSIID